MEELLTISAYRDTDNNLWYRVKILLHNDCLIFDASPYNFEEQETLFRIISCAKSIIRFDANYFDKLCGDESEYTWKNTDRRRIEQFVKDYPLKDLDGNSIDTLLQYGDYFAS